MDVNALYHAYYRPQSSESTGIPIRSFGSNCGSKHLLLEEEEGGEMRQLAVTYSPAAILDAADLNST